MSLRLFCLASVLAVGACSVQAPITGVMESGEPVSGIARASLSGDGTVTVSSGGSACHGTYNALSQAEILTVPLTCDDQITGLAQVERSADLMSGTGTFELSDNRRGTFSYVVQ